MPVGRISPSIFSSWNLTPRTYHRITAWALGLLALIVVSGAAVRLTGSGLGCSDWPTCEQDQLVADLEFHALIEFGNRLVTGPVSVAVVAAAIGSRLRRPRLAGLTGLSLGLVAGVLAQILLGALLVRTHLDPRFTIGHFLLSMVLIANAVVLHHRADPDPPPIPHRQPTGATQRLSLDRLSVDRLRIVLGAVATTVLVTGTLVTGAGPHGGDDAAARLNLDIQTMARIHGFSVMVLVATTLLLTILVVRHGRGPVGGRVLLQRYLLVLVGQAGIGYAQYFTGVPVLLVWLHVIGATLVWTMTVHLIVRLGRPLPTHPTAPQPSSGRTPALPRS